MSYLAEMLSSLLETPSELIITYDGTPEEVKVFIEEGIKKVVISFTVPYDFCWGLIKTYGEIFTKQRENNRFLYLTKM